MKLIPTVVVALTLLVAAPVASQAQEADAAPTVVINFTSDDVWTSHTALGFARNLQNAGAEIVVFLNVRDVRSACRCAASAAASGPWARGRLIIVPEAVNQRWSLDLVSDALADGRRVSILDIDA